MMKRLPAITLCIPIFTLVVMVFLSAGCMKKSVEQSPIERGEYLTIVGGCGDCHSPKTFAAAGPAPDTTRLLSGHPTGTKLPEIPAGTIGPSLWGALTTNDMTAWAGPWGVSFAYNLTPDRATGIGNWDEGLFIQSIRTGKFMGTSRDMLPPMPWQDMEKMTDKDLKAIFAYLKTLPPIDNAIPPPLPPQQQ
jgi:mono/diheme cytochrome c family protein